jgi:ABC-type Fe3+ transport system substrate-binding protein
MQDGALQKYVIPTEQPLPSQVNLPAGYQGVLGFDTEVIAYNPKELAEHHIPVPTSMADFANPQWEGHFSIIPTAPDIYQGMIQEYGQTKAQTLMAAIGNNKPRFETSHTQAALDVQSGVTWAAMSANGQGVLPLTKATPATIQMVNPDPMFIKFELMDLAKNAPHPAAARLFLNWLSSQAGQQTMESTSGHSSVRTDVTENPAVWDPSKATPLYLQAYETTAAFNTQYAQYQQDLHTSS